MSAAMSDPDIVFACGPATLVDAVRQHCTNVRHHRFHRSPNIRLGIVFAQFIGFFQRNASRDIAVQGIVSRRLVCDQIGDDPPPYELWIDFSRIADQTNGKRLALLTKLNETMNDKAALIFVAHDLNPRGLSPKVHGFVQAQSWFQDLTPVTVEP